MTGGVTLQTAAAWRTEVTSSCRVTRRTLAGPHRSPRRIVIPQSKSHLGPPLQRVIVQRFTVMTGGHDQHSVGDKLIADLGAGLAYQEPSSGVRNVGESATGRLLCQ
jgi:hypothetical protein